MMKDECRFVELAKRFQALEECFLNAPEAVTDAEAVIRVELANTLARVGVLIDALAADEQLRKDAE